MRPCSKAGCPELVPKGGYCPRHKRERSRNYDAWRGNRHERGYGSRWERYSRARLREFPFCVLCDRLAEHTDHIVSARDEPARFWDPTNHQSLCADCNRRKAIAEEGGFGRPRRASR
jgi:5-methylcytosine-specific restriction protein A